ncbi:hypothetical protein [Brevundimonas sp. DWR2-3-1b1]|uniref:hypothetical protein n=1 Tax=unclassified Brevundimonas TaxID=2622653 RepID=UPI003CE6A9D3
MTPDELNDALDAMQTAAGEDSDRRPGLIEVRSDEWVNGLADMPVAKPKTIVDGIRIRDIKVAVSAGVVSRVLPRAEAGERGQPYRDLASRT